MVEDSQASHPPSPAEALRRESYCPACGKPGVVFGLDYALLETVPTVRLHACGVGGPGAAEVDQ